MFKLIGATGVINGRCAFYDSPIRGRFMPML